MGKFKKGVQSLGGSTTAKKYGSSYMSKLARKSHKKRKENKKNVKK
jgi:hypothetical protein